MAFLENMMRIESAILVAGFILVVGWKLLRAMLRPENRQALRRYFGEGISAIIRVQLLTGTLIFAFLYLAGLLQSAGSGAFPPIPNYAVALLAGSQAVFAGAAAWRSLRSFGILRNEGEK